MFGNNSLETEQHYSILYVLINLKTLSIGRMNNLLKHNLNWCLTTTLVTKISNSLLAILVYTVLNYIKKEKRNYFSTFLMFQLSDK